MSADLGFASGVRLISASAGSGKTFRLTQEVTRAVSSTTPGAIELEELVAVTYTRKAQAELEARIRRALLEDGAFDRANQLSLAYLGTVHSIGLRLIQEFALDAGLSPAVDVIPGNEGRRLLQATLEQELEPALRARLQELSLDLQLNWDHRTSRSDWLTPVDEIMSLARGNRIRPERLAAMGRRSIEGLLAILPASAPEGTVLERALASEVESALAQISKLDDDTEKTTKVIQQLRSSLRDLQHARLTWCDWARLSRLDPSKRTRPCVEPVKRAATAYITHPRLRAQLIELTELIFEAARVGLVTYAKWKAERGLVDYVDMIDLALGVLELPSVEGELKGRLGLVVVDEFQDTSPIQLALFARLHVIARRSVWVGDRKQCIFEYAGADPALMDAVMNWVSAGAGDHETLELNRRSRPELVQFNTDLFSAAFAEHGYSAQELQATAYRPALPELSAVPPLGVWWLEGKEQHTALAAGIARLLGEGSTHVLDRATQRVRRARPGDIAVLVYSNAEAERLSSALKERGIVSVLPRVGLLATPEGTLVAAALSYLVDARDTLASAELDALTGFDGRTAPEWLDKRIREASTPSELLSSVSGWKARLECLRQELSVLSPAETVDRVLSVLDVCWIAIGWPDPQQRVGNLEALRALAAAYEQRCAYQREAASLAGLLRYFDETQQVIRQRDEERATDEQHVGHDADAVVISTFHKSKGLEWPIVIVASLNRERRRDAFEVTPESDSEGFDASQPLAGRWIRYWPWPLSPTQRGSGPLAERAEESEPGRAIAEREHRERVRLLYVAFTRARDHLVLAVPLRKTSGPATAWLDELRDARGPVLTLPEPDAVQPEVVIRGCDARVVVGVQSWRLGGRAAADEPDEDDSQLAASSDRYWFARSSNEELANIPAYRIAPSKAAEGALEFPAARVLSVDRFTRRMAFTNTNGTTWDAIGTALHGFLAADQHELGAEERGVLARRILMNAELGGMFAADTLLAASDAFRSYVESRWPSAKWHREIPISALLDTDHGARRIEGTIDLLLEAESGYVIVDHKSFPGRQEHWAERALGYAPQLFTYAKAIRMTGAEVLAMLVHFTVGGGVVEVAGERASTKPA